MAVILPVCLSSACCHYAQQTVTCEKKMRKDVETGDQTEKQPRGLQKSAHNSRSTWSRRSTLTRQGECGCSVIPTSSVARAHLSCPMRSRTVPNIAAAHLATPVAKGATPRCRRRFSSSMGSPSGLEPQAAPGPGKHLSRGC